jgi:hypothetical protein
LGQELDIKIFFKRAPHAALQKYFVERGHLLDFDWSTISPRKVEALLERWLGLDAETRGTMVSDFSDIKLLATPTGKVQILDEAEFHEAADEIRKQLPQFPDFYDCAFWVFFEHRKCWDGAVFYAIADGKQKRYWRKRINMPRLVRLPVEEDAKALALAVAAVFRREEARGENCIVHPYRRGSGAREYYFAYPQDHHQNALEYSGGEMTKRPSNPAFEVIFVHDDANQTLSIWHQGPAPRVKDLQVAFAEAVLGAKIERDSPRDDRVYELDQLLDADFVFNPKTELGIASVEIRKLTVRIMGHEPYRLSIDLADDTPVHVLHQRLAAATRGISPSLVKVARVGLRAVFNANANETRTKQRSFELAWPNSCSINNDALGNVLQRMLTDHGIEPKSPPKETTDGANTD